MRSERLWSASIVFALALVSCQSSSPPRAGDARDPSARPAPAPAPRYPVHADIVTTVFWVGESADASNSNISNRPSAWDDLWTQHYGGVDSPDRRNGYLPRGFIPGENPFYFALPYNDFDGGRKADARSVVYWAGERAWQDDESMCKNRWIRITHGARSAYAQWEDVGPFLENDSAYVFGGARPSNTQLARAGLDVSPAVQTYLGLEDIDRVSWQFVDASEVPDGPWKRIVSTRRIHWR